MGELTISGQSGVQAKMVPCEEDGILFPDEGTESQHAIANACQHSFAWKQRARAMVFLVLGFAPLALLLLGVQPALHTGVLWKASADAIVVKVAPVMSDTAAKVAPVTSETAANKSIPARKHPSLWPSLFCFALMQSHGPELDLMKSQFNKRAGIFGCNDQAVFCDGGNITLGPWDNGVFTTLPVPKVAMKKGNVAIPGQMTNSWLNVELFNNVFNAMLQDGRFWMYDWVVKVDPDAVFFPDRLRKHVEPLTPRNGPGELYIRNCGVNPYIHLMGAIEVFSTPAMQKYFDEKWKCESKLQWGGWGEDYYMEHCMALLKVNFVNDFKLLGQSGCEFANCENSWRAAFHPFKTVDAWWECWERSGR